MGEKAYDSDPLEEALLLEQGIEMIAPHRKNRRKEKTQDGRKLLRRYKRRWKVERLFGWLQNFRRLLVRYEYKVRELPGHGAAWVHRDSAQKVFMRWLLETTPRNRSFHQEVGVDESRLARLLDNLGRARLRRCRTV